MTNLYSNNIKIDEKSYKNVLIYYIEYGKIKDLKYIKINNVNPLYLIFNKVNEETNGNKYLRLVLTDESKEKIKKYEELWIKIRDLIRSVTKSSDDYGENYMKIKFNSDDELPLNEMIEISTMIIVVRAVSLKIINIHKFFR